MWRDNVWYRHMKPKLEKVGLGWANFQVLRRTHASLGHAAKVAQPTSAATASAWALDVYTQSSIEARRAGTEMLEKAVLSSYSLPKIRQKNAPKRLNGVECSR